MNDDTINEPSADFSKFSNDININPIIFINNHKNISNSGYGNFFDDTIPLPNV